MSIFMDDTLIEGVANIVVWIGIFVVCFMAGTMVGRR